jgi:hypothetical protein
MAHTSPARSDETDEERQSASGRDMRLQLYDGLRDSQPRELALAYAAPVVTSPRCRTLSLSLGAGLYLAACNAGSPIISSTRDAAPAVDDDVPADASSSPAATPDAFFSVSDATFEVAPAEKVLVYAHSGSDLFSVDPQTLQFSRVGYFLIAGPPVKYLNEVTDIAVDRAGRIVGTTFDQLLDIDPQTAVCKPIAKLPVGSSFNGLSWIRTDAAEEQLLATTLDGGVFRIDPATGNATLIGPLGPGLQSSGDLVSVAGYGTLVTLKGPSSDRLARIDPATGAATVIGDTGFKQIWGLGFWGSRVFGFTMTGDFILIDPKTGAGMKVESMPAFPFWGAGVTTSVPVIL